MHHFHDARDWFFRHRYGLFLHWGLYAVGGLHEQELSRYGTPWEAYLKYQEAFDPVKFNPAEWLDLAQRNGMEYVVFTAKHHDGFCMWDTKETEFNVMHTPYGRDVLRELADECYRRRMPLVLYYSVVDWHHPNYPNLGRHHELVTDPVHHDVNRYLQFLKNQLRELCTDYGEIHGIWWDMNVPEIHDPSVNAMIRELQPAAVINNRGCDAGDFSTPERHFQKDPTLPFANPTEACNSVGVNSWGYRVREDYYTAGALERQLASNMALGGNYLLNVGPKPDGTIPEEAAALLESIGGWFRKVSSALTAAPCAGVLESKAILCTGGGTELNLIVTEPLTSGTLKLAPLNILPEKAVLLNTGEEVEATLEPIVYERQNPPVLRLRGIPAERLSGTVPVFRLTFRDPVIRGSGAVSENSAGIHAKE